MLDKIKDMLDQGFSKRSISQELGIGYSTVRKYTKGTKSTYYKTAHHCEDCGETKTSKFYGAMKNRCKQCHNELGYKKQKTKIFEYAQSRGKIACQRCGYDKIFDALEWHHRDPGSKDPTWNRGWSIDRLKPELDKCDLVCANCHREIHYEWRSREDSNLRHQV